MLRCHHHFQVEPTHHLHSQNSKFYSQVIWSRGEGQSALFSALLTEYDQRHEMIILNLQSQELSKPANFCIFLGWGAKVALWKSEVLKPRSVQKCQLCIGDWGGGSKVALRKSEALKSRSVQKCKLCIWRPVMWHFGNLKS